MSTKNVDKAAAEKPSAEQKLQMMHLMALALIEQVGTETELAIGCLCGMLMYIDHALLKLALHRTDLCGQIEFVFLRTFAANYFSDCRDCRSSKGSRTACNGIGLCARI